MRTPELRTLTSLQGRSKGAERRLEKTGEGILLSRQMQREAQEREKVRLSIELVDIRLNILFPDAGTADNPESELWRPFDSELDWQVGSWAIKEEVHQGAVDRLLSIPGVRLHTFNSSINTDALFQFREKLGLSYHNMHALLQKVDSMLARAKWREEWLTFKDRPGERHLIQFRDIIEAIRALLGNPAHADHIVYRPSKLFSCSACSNRIYTEMWTGKWWQAVQVSKCA